MLLARTWGWKKPPPPAWSTALIAASRTIKFWKALISDLAAAQANVDLILLQIGTFLQWDSMIPLETNPAEAKVKLAQNGPCYKLMVKTMEDTHDLEEVRNAAHDILTLMVQVLDLVSEEGFILERWIKVISVMIYKNPGVYLIDEMRVIHLFEADYNFVIGTIFGRRALYSRVNNHTLHLSQWAQPGCQCSDAVIMQELTIGVSKMTKTPLAGFENDALTYYNQIVMNLVSAVFDWMGVPQGPIRLQEKTLLQVVHYLKAGFGISTTSNTSNVI